MPGNLGDLKTAVPLRERVALPQRRIAATAYAAESLRDWLRARRVDAVIPASASRHQPYPLDHRA